MTYARTVSPGTSGNPPKTADAVVIGGGVIGTSIAYHLAKKGFGRVALLEKSYLASGSTGRCGAGVRQQWGTKLNCLLSVDSVRAFERMDEELGYSRSIEFKQGGYLLLAYTRREADQFRENVKLQHKLGIPVSLLTPEEAGEIVPILNTDGIYLATFCPTDGHANPFHVTYAYATAAKRLGVTIHTFTEACEIGTRSGKVESVRTNRGTIEAKVVINAAGPYSGAVAKMVGLDIPFYPERHQILVTEPVDPVLGPMVMSFSRRFYCQQTPHGSFIMGMGDPKEKPGFSISSTREFLVEMAEEITKVLPPVRGLSVVRQWAGLYDMTPDAHPILGSTPCEGFYLACGFSGHGFMLGPVTGKLISEIVCDERPSIDIHGLDLGRFERGELVIEPSVV
ncbi:MAG: FAD-binding oxidoreductase [Firmicutes bacterium]|jgi:sarcosine oxidase subunit beta|nr:FAD-binding oxidoreductase [Bacillota bacterium]